MKKESIIKIEKVRSREDLLAILKLINGYASQGLMLTKTSHELLRLKNYLIAKENSKVIGGAGLKEWSSELVEVVSLAVDPSASGKGIGTMLIEKSIIKAKNYGYKKIFTLTLRPNIFIRLGFKKASINSFPEKIWGDCKNCPKNASGPNDPKCDEIALVMIF